MSKIFMQFFMVLILLALSGCTSTVRGVNYELYKGRLKAQSYLTGRSYKPVPMIVKNRRRRNSHRIQRVVAKRRSFQVARPQARKVKVRLASRRVARKHKPIVKIGRVYRQKVKPKARTVYRRSIAPSAQKIPPRRHANPVYYRPVVVRKPKVQQRRARPVYKRPAIHKAYIAPPRKRVVAQRPYRAPQRKTVVKRPYIAPKAVVQRPLPVAPQIPVDELNDRLFNASKAGNTAQINALLAQGAQINSSNMSRETPLHGAAALGRSAAVNLLLQKGANPNATTTGGWTPLHSAARFKHTQIARLLIARGARVNARNNQGKTPLALATQIGASTTATALAGLGGK